MLSRRHLRVAIFLFLLSVFISVAAFGLLYLRGHREELREHPLSKAETAGARYVGRDGTPFSLMALSGDVVVVYAWGSRAPQSADGLTLLSRLSAEYEEGNVHFIALNRSEERDTMEAYLASIGDPGGMTYIGDDQDLFLERPMRFGTPYLVIFKKDGTIGAAWQGTLVEADVRSAIDRVLREV